MGEKQQWSNDHLKCLLETCIEEINTVGRKGLSLHKDSWNKLGKVLKEKFGLDLTQKQMKNAYDNLKAKYVGWVYLKNKTGNIYNPQTNTFTLTNEEWEEFKKGHPKAASLKTVPLPFPELCAELFDGNTATGNCKWTSTQTTSGVGSSCHHV
ncbi:L10-interacting MYB domain-containing protein isoform X1 [Helianthus annuus]|nr:L10-interacting MYB domain-containing protein isoform X1 [Helianthus annuus]